MSMQLDVLLSASLFVAFASILRGLTGFGFALVATPLLSLVLPPMVAVPVVALLQIPSGLPILLRDWRNIDLRAVGLVTLGGTPTLVLGVYIVATMSADIMRLAVGAAVVLSMMVLASGINIGRPPSGIESFGAGILGGLLQGAVAMAGPPIIMLGLASSWSARRCRATFSCVFIFLGAASAVVAGLHGIITKEGLMIVIFSLPALLLGQYFGNFLFDRVDSKKYRTISILSVAATGALVMVKGLAPFF